MQRKLGEFSVGSCQCGAVYTSDPTGHNVGAAMVEALVYACDDNWDLAWELIPGDDYLTGRIENYDEQTHQVLEARNLDGRAIRGVIYFVRLHKELADLSKRLREKQEPAAAGTAPAPAIEPERHPKRQRQRADKKLVLKLVLAKDIDGLVDLTFDDIRTLRFLQRLLYEPGERQRWLTAHLLGQVCARLSTRQPGPVSDLLHRLFESSSDSASTNWGLIESVGAIVAARSDIFGAFTRHLLPYVRDPATRIAALWGLGTIARHRPDLIRRTPFFQLLPLLDHEEPAVRGHMLRLLGRIKATEAAAAMEKLQDDHAELIIYEEGEPNATTVGKQAREALSLLRPQGESSRD
ncbi:MAG: HEAT repeat domain-containing protein [Desulfobacteraceae bacterium]|nr:HEAT repeat domain-containing protein [Desulfobacteraceae bacterium]